MGRVGFRRNAKTRTLLLLTVIALLSVMTVAGCVRVYEKKIENDQLETKLIQQQEELRELKIQVDQLYAATNISARAAALGMHKREPEDVIVVHVPAGE